MKLFSGIRKDADVADVHVSTTGDRKKVKVPDVIDDQGCDGDGDPNDDVGKVMKVAGVDEGLGLVFGWGIVCKEAGQPYVDTQNDHIPEDAMAKASTDFMKNSRQAGEMHDRMDAGAVVHSFPLTGDIAKAMGVASDKTGWMVAVAPDPAMFAKFKSGEYTGFSIGGRILSGDA